MQKLIEIRADQYQHRLLSGISSAIGKTRNVSTYLSIKFAHYCIASSGTKRLAFRNETKRLQKDIYVGGGLELSSVKNDAVPNEPLRGEALAPSFCIEGDVAPQLRELVASGFAGSEPAAVSRAIWIFGDVIDCVIGDAWTFGEIRDGRFSPLPPFDLGPSITVEQAEQYAANSRLETMIKGKRFDEEKARLYLSTEGIPVEEKMNWARKHVRERQDLYGIISYLIRCLALTWDEAKEVHSTITPLTLNADDAS